MRWSMGKGRPIQSHLTISLRMVVISVSKALVKNDLSIYTVIH